MSKLSKINILTSLLMGDALKWATAVMETNSEGITMFDRFVTMFKCVFNHSPEGKEVSERLLSHGREWMERAHAGHVNQPGHSAG